MAVKGEQNYLEKTAGFPGGDNVIKVGPALFLGWRSLAPALQGPESFPRIEHRRGKIATCPRCPQASTFSGPGGRPNSEPHIPGSSTDPCCVLSRRLKLVSRSPPASKHAFV